MDTISTDVLVVGAGPAGLTAAALLARLGIDAVTVTKYGTANSPRAHITNQRAVEILRDLGLEDRVMARALAQDQMGTQVFATAFAGRELSRMMTFGAGDERTTDYRRASPTSMCNIPQHHLEPILLEGAREFGADIRLHHEVRSIEQSDHGVRALVRPRNGDPEFTVAARYAIGCDGAHTVVGRDGDFRFEGQAGLGHAITVWIEADLRAYAAHRPGALFITVTPEADDLTCVWTCVEQFTEWSTILVRPGMTESELDEASIRESVRASIGDDRVPFTIKKISPWEFNHVVASDYRQRRLFIAGDAAHRHPPANGLGSNTSMQDTYNLCWKLALVLRGTAGDGLLDSYSAERQPVGRQVVDRANQSVAEMLEWFGPTGLVPGMDEAAVAARLADLFGPAGGADREAMFAGLELMNGQFNAHGVELNQRYVSDAVAPDGTPPEPFVRDPELYHQFSSRPGSPVPHAWIVDDDGERSTLDLCAYNRFTLIVGADHDGWRDAAEAAANQTGVEISVTPISLGLDHSDAYGQWHARREISDDGALLIRPDRIVAWRCETRPDDPTAALSEALDQILGRAIIASG